MTASSSRAVFGLPQPWALATANTTFALLLPARWYDLGGALVISDAREHPVLRDNPAIRDLGIIAYAGVPLITPSGNVLGTLCAIDHQPRHWTPEQIEILSNLAGSVLSERRAAQPGLAAPARGGERGRAELRSAVGRRSADFDRRRPSGSGSWARASRAAGRLA